MTTAAILNIAAWALCGVMGVLLFGDFIRTEITLRREKEECGGSGDERE